MGVPLGTSWGGLGDAWGGLGAALGSLGDASGGLGDALGALLGKAMQKPRKNLLEIPSWRPKGHLRINRGSCAVVAVKRDPSATNVLGRAGPQRY